MSEPKDMDIHENLSAYLDGELSDRRKRHVEEALAGDQALRTELDELHRTRNLLTQLPRRDAPDDFVQRVLCEAERNRLMTEQEPASNPDTRRSRWIRYVASAAVVLIVASVGILMTTHLYTPDEFHADNNRTTTDAHLGTPTGSRDADPEAPESLGWAPELVMVTQDVASAAGRVEDALKDAGFLPVEKASERTDNPLYEWISRSDGRAALAVYYETEGQRRDVEKRLSAIRDHHPAGPLTRWNRPVELHVRREALAGRDVARFARRSGSAGSSLGSFLREHWAQLTLPLGETGDGDSWAAFDGRPFREKTPEEEASDLFRRSLRALRKEQGLARPEPDSLEDDRDEIDRIVQDSLAELHRRPMPTTRAATNAATSAELKLMLISVIGDGKARELIQPAD